MLSAFISSLVYPFAHILNAGQMSLYMSEGRWWNVTKRIYSSIVLKSFVEVLVLYFNF